MYILIAFSKNGKISISFFFLLLILDYIHIVYSRGKNLPDLPVILRNIIGDKGLRKRN